MKWRSTLRWRSVRQHLAQGEKLPSDLDLFSLSPFTKPVVHPAFHERRTGGTATLLRSRSRDAGTSGPCRRHGCRVLPSSANRHRRAFECQPGRPSLHGDGHAGSPGLKLHSTNPADRAWLVDLDACAARRSSSRLPDSCHRRRSSPPHTSHRRCRRHRHGHAPRAFRQRDDLRRYCVARGSWSGLCTPAQRRPRPWHG